MKKLISLLLVLALVFSLTACKAREDKADVKEQNDTTTNENVDSDDSVDNNDSIDTDETSNLYDGEQATIAETLLVDEADVKITATGLSYDEDFGVDVEFLIENNSDKDLTFQVINASVNGYMIETIMSTDIAAGKKANDAATLLDYDFELSGISTIADIEFAFHIYASDDMEDYLITKQISLTTSAAESFEYSYDDAGTQVYDENGITIVSKGLIEADPDLEEPGVIFYINNNSENGITVQDMDVSVNGFMMDTFYSAEILPGKHDISVLTFNESDLEEIGIADISDITEIELSFSFSDIESWDDIGETETITLTF